MVRWLTYLLLTPLIALATAGFGFVSLLCGVWDRSGAQQHTVARWWAKTLLLLSLSPVEVIEQGAGGWECAGRGAVYVSNHLSYFDTPVLFAKLPFQFRIMAKQSLWQMPFIGWYLRRSGQVPIDSKSPRSAVSGLLRGVRTLEGGLPLVLFPEGGRAATPAMTPFHSGAAWMAIRAQVPIIPVALVGTHELLPMHTYHLTPRVLRVVVGTPVSTIGMTVHDAEALTQKLFAEIGELYRANEGERS